SGAASFWPSGFDKLIAYFVWILSTGNPSKEQIERIACWFPPLLGALTIFLVWLVGKEMFSNKVGLLAAFLFAFQPTHIDYSKLGKVDHHVAETFSALLIYYFFIKLLKSISQGNCPAKARNENPQHTALQQSNSPALRTTHYTSRNILWSLLTAFAIYFAYIMWSGATLYIIPLFSGMYIFLFFIPKEYCQKHLLFYLSITLFALTFLLYPCLSSYYSKYDAIHFLTGKSTRFTHDALSLFQLSLFS
ncbi:MAG: STT3 domain-containing protein, partial [Elusimicrobiota bacterium]|nr:STT3 domain-containing protein [Elusimicrobiota bacterium]